MSFDFVYAARSSFWNNVDTCIRVRGREPRGPLLYQRHHQHTARGLHLHCILLESTRDGAVEKENPVHWFKRNEKEWAEIFIIVCRLVP